MHGFMGAVIASAGVEVVSPHGPWSQINYGKVALLGAGCGLALALLVSLFRLVVGNRALDAVSVGMVTVFGVVAMCILVNIMANLASSGGSTDAMVSTGRSVAAYYGVNGQDVKFDGCSDGKLKTCKPVDTTGYLTFTDSNNVLHKARLVVENGRVRMLKADGSEYPVAKKDAGAKTKTDAGTKASDVVSPNADMSGFTSLKSGR